MYEPMYVDSCIVVFVICIICVYGHIYKYVFPIMLKLINYDHCNYQNNFNTILIYRNMLIQNNLDINHFQ